MRVLVLYAHPVETSFGGMGVEHQDAHRLSLRRGGARLEAGEQIGLSG